MNIFGAIGWLFSVIINRPLGFILGLCYHFVRNYGLALILFTVITRVCLLPLAVKQQKSMADNARIQPKIQQLQKKYAKDKQKLNEEMMKLYQEEGFNPMGGCLPLLIQMPILFGLFNVIYKPLSYMIGLTTNQVSSVVRALWPQIKAIAGSDLGKNITVAQAINNGRIEIYAANAMRNNMDKLGGIVSANTPQLDFGFLGMDLSATPKLTSITHLSWLLLIPLLCYFTSLLSSWYNMKVQKQTMPQGQNMAGMNISMLLIMPLVSAYFAFTVPAGVGFYWICTNLFMILQTWLMNKFYNPQRLAALAEEKAAKRKEMRRPAGVTPKDVSEENESEQTSNEQSAAAESANKRAAAPVRQAPRGTSSGKKSKKQLMEENRRRLSASRQSEKKNGGK